jgi:hypothetical protein
MDARTQYDSVISELDDLCQNFMVLEGDLVKARTSSAIIIGKISEQSSEKKNMLEVLKKKVVSLREQVATDKVRIEFLEKAADEEGGNTGALEEAFRVCQEELVKQLDEKNDVEYRLESSRTNARLLKATADELDVKLEASNKIKIVVLAQNEELKREIDVLRAASMSNAVVKQELADLRAVSMSNAVVKQELDTLRVSQR